MPNIYNILFFLFSSFIVAQTPVLEEIRTVAENIKKQHKTKDAQAKAAFTYVAQQIRYDLKEYEHINFSGTIEYESEADLQKALREIDLKIIARTWKQKASVCEGYALLYKEFCRFLNIECVVVRGFTKTQPKEIGSNRTVPDHTWNAININGKWKLVDTTWASGYVTNMGWIKAFNPDFYNMDPKRAILTHFPEKPKWQLLENTISKKNFFTYPVYYSQSFKYNIALSAPTVGSLKASNNIITIKFKKIPQQPLSYAYPSDRYAQPIEFQKSGTELIATIPKKNEPYLTLYIEGMSVLDFRVK